MKKILLIILIIIFVSGCYDYKELNNIAIITGIAIDYDYQNNLYHLTYEILSEQKDNDTKSYYVDSTSNNINDAINKLESKINKIPYYAHLKILLLNKNIINKKSINFYEYFLRNPNITTTFSVILTDIDANKILKEKSNDSDVTSQKIYNIINNKNTSNKIIHNYSFEKFIDILNNNKVDLVLPSITLNDKDICENSYYYFDKDFNEYKLTYNEAKLLNLVLYSDKISLRLPCDNHNNYTSIDIYNNKTNYSFSNNKLNIDIKSMASILENQCNYNLKDKKTYIKLQNQYNNYLNKEYKNFIKTLKNNNTDILGLNYKYYKEYRNTIEFNKLNININSDITINKNGLIFEVK